MKTAVLILQMISSILLVVLIALQGKGSGLGGTFGGGNQTYHARKGVEKIVFRGTLIAGAVFILTSIASVLV